MKRKYYIYDTQGNWLGNVYSRTKKEVYQEAKSDYKDRKILIHLN